MSTEPKVSIVMGVRDGAADIAQTMDSLLSQEGVAFEIIAVNDGSRDGTASALEDYASRDNRVRVFHRPPSGLTRSLIFGCAQARGDYIARQDCGDRSLPGRLALEAQALDAHTDAALASVGARFIGPRNETLYEIAQDTADLQLGLSQRTLASICGPSHHGATMFRKSAYDRAGGYRAAFEVAQDLDLWLRLLEIGDCVTTRSILYEARLTAGAISQLRREEQLRATRVILECAALRRSGNADAERIKAWREQETQGAGSRLDDARLSAARFHCFLANVLRRRDPARAREYYLESLRQFFWQPKVWVRLLLLEARF